MFLAELLIEGLAVWPLGSFLATVAYLFAFALEIAEADAIQWQVRDDAPER